MISSDPSRLPTPKRASARLCAAINQLAFPGLGTILMGRRVGFAQAAIMLTGFCLATGFLVWYVICAIRYAANPTWSQAEWTSHYRPYQWLRYCGLGLCAAAGIWALLSSIGMLRQGARKSGTT